MPKSKEKGYFRCGPMFGPPHAEPGTTIAGFTVGDRVEVTDDSWYRGWRGTVINFDENGFIAVKLSEPRYGGSYFAPDTLRKIDV